MTARLADMVLRHVDPSRLLFQQRHPAFQHAVAPPEWYQSAKRGELHFAPWIHGTVLAVMEMKAEKPAYFAVVGVLGLYMTDEQAEMQERGEIDNSTLEEATPEEIRAFQERVVQDLYPFVRAELYELTGRLQGVIGVMLQPYPLIDEPSVKEWHGDMSTRDEIALKATNLRYTVTRNISTTTDTFERPKRRVSVRYNKAGEVVEVQVEPGTHNYPANREGALSALEATTKRSASQSRAKSRAQPRAKSK